MHGSAAGRLIRHVVRADDDLTSGDLAQSPGILASDSDPAAPLLRQSRVIQPQDALGRILRHQSPHALVLERLGGPRAHRFTEVGAVSVEVATTAAAIVAQVLCGRSVRKPVTEHSTFSRLVERRNSSAKGSRDMASSGSVSGLALGTTEVSLRNNTVSIGIKGNAAYASMQRKMDHKLTT